MIMIKNYGNTGIFFMWNFLSEFGLKKMPVFNLMFVILVCLITSFWGVPFWAPVSTLY